MHLFKLSSAPTYIALTADVFGETIGTAPDALHASQMFTYERGSLVLKSQALTYVGLATFAKHLQHESSRSAYPLPKVDDELPRGGLCTLPQISAVLAAPDEPIERLRDLLSQAGHIVSPNTENCTKLNEWMSEYIMNNQDIDLLFSDGVFDAYEEFIGSTIAKMMRLSHLSEDLNRLSVLLRADSTTSTSRSSRPSKPWSKVSA